MINKMNQEFFDVLDRGTQNLIKWQYHLGDDFNTHLFRTIARANIDNIERLKREFPQEVEAYINFTQKIGWWKSIEKGLFGNGI